MTEEPNRFEISRRKTLAALGTIGAASAGAGLGTSAWFSDTESFDDNIVTAGTMDLIVGYHSWWDQGMAGSGTVSGEVDGDAVTAELPDLKPGDSGLIALSPRIETNPAHLWLTGELTANDEKGLNEAEQNHSDDESGGEGGEWEGELAQNVEVAVKYCDIDGEVDSEDFGPAALDSESEIWAGTLAEFLTAIQTGVPLDGASEVPEDGGFTEPGEQSCFAGTEDDAGTPSLCLDWKVPTTVGNEIQSDAVTFDLQLYAEQCRHNDGSENPCVDESFTAPYKNDSDSAVQIEGTLRMDVKYGETSVAYHVQMDDDDDGPKMSDPLNDVTNVWVPFDTNDDGTMDFQIQWHPAAGLPEDPFGYKAHSGSWGSIEALPAGVSAMETDEGFVVVVPKTMLGGSGAYRIGAHMSAGGEAPYAAISTESDSGEIVPSGDFSDAAYLIPTTVP